MGEQGTRILKPITKRKNRSDTKSLFLAPKIFNPKVLAPCSQNPCSKGPKNLLTYCCHRPVSALYRNTKPNEQDRQAIGGAGRFTNPKGSNG